MYSSPPQTIRNTCSAFVCRTLRKIHLLCLAGAALFVWGLPTLAQLESTQHPAGYYAEPFRPQFHFTPERNWMNDPNGLVFYEGEYHLFYQYNPFDSHWGHMSWGHAVSRDLVHWEHLPLALPEADGVMIFSGSAVVDWNNSSGFGTNGMPPLVAIYTGHRPADGRQFQCLAFSNDKGRTWTKYSGNPVIDIGERDFRDPKVQWHAPTKRWIMTVALSTQRKIRFYSSPNLKDWTQLSEFGPAGSTGGVWECPDLFELPVEGARHESHWVLVVNVSSGAPAGGCGGQYFIGQFDGTNYLADSQLKFPMWLDDGKDFYAAVSWSDIPKADGRRILLGWMVNGQYAGEVPTAPWRSAMSIPRAVALRKVAGNLQLVQHPVRELQSLRDRHLRFTGGTAAKANDWLRKNALATHLMEIMVELQPAEDGVQGLNLFVGSQPEVVVGVERQSGTVYLDRRKAGRADFHRQFPGVHRAALAVPKGKIQLHLFVDASSLEVFVNDGEMVFTDLVLPSPGSRGLEVFSSDENSRAIKQLDIWTLKSSWK